ncbi:hypothetical protein SISSUDRAFT_1052424 [Sistotremastrum suecicum HHB10207 ss-3]|uniref:Mitochondrial distribution and morphology protein 12 n=1 Tax=Sistotremastrum suecicum HHB10207 ss-3 TaxID=1314776 RepID=A0A165ZXC3_9AGAM|nr:hypothetical protein SISSUDRAFT_1052424 [Sistotremastrum suecicum HHB10207 ss-3]
MSIDLEWSSLDSTLAENLVDMINRQLQNTPRPSFIGPVQVTSLDFGVVHPDVEIVDIRDIYRDFLDADDDDLEDHGDPVKVSGDEADEDAFEWVSRKAMNRGAASEGGPAYHHLPPHLRYARGPSAESVRTSPGGLHSPDLWGTSSLPNFYDSRPPFPLNPSLFGQPTARSQTYPGHSTPVPQPPPPPPPESVGPNSAAAQNVQSEDDVQQPNLQLHFRVAYHSDIRLSISTSLLINYPSPVFMSLPIKLCVTSLVLNTEVVVAYEGKRGRVHICLLDDLDPYGPAGDRQSRSSQDHTPSDPEGPLPSKPLPVGMRILPSIFIESEIGQADKHVLKNVTRVEKFIQDVIRKTVEEELVFPNFHTIILP